MTYSLVTNSHLGFPVMPALMKMARQFTRPVCGYNVVEETQTPFAGTAGGDLHLKRENQTCAMYAKPMLCRGYTIVGRRAQSRPVDLHPGSDLSVALASSQTLLEHHHRTGC